MEVKSEPTEGGLRIQVQSLDPIDKKTKRKKVVFCVPTITRPYQETLDSLAASVPYLTAAGWDDGLVSEIGCPYISAARATMLRKALDAKADVIVFIDHDLSWDPPALLKLIQTEGHVVAGTYRFKKDEEEYMGGLVDGEDRCPVVRPSDGAISARCVPAGFLKITRFAINLLAKKHPELLYGEPMNPHLDLFNHGVHEGIWYGEDYAFCRRWKALGGDIWIVPDLNLHHYNAGTKYAGNYHMFLRKRPGGDLSEDPDQIKLAALMRQRDEAARAQSMIAGKPAMQEPSN
jgi:hypothetical protein